MSPLFSVATLTENTGRLAHPCTESVCLYTHARNKHTQAMSAMLGCMLGLLVPSQLLARPAAALSSSTAEQPAGAIGPESLDVRLRRHSKSGYIIEADLKTSKAGHAAGASCQPPHVRAAHLATKSSPTAHAQLVTRNTHVPAQLALPHGARNPSRNPFAENTSWP